MRSATSCLGRGAVCAVAMMSWVCGAAAGSSSDSAHALAQKFSQAAEDGERTEEARKAEARKAQAEAKKKADAEKRKAAEAQRATEEAEMLRNAQAEAEARRAADQARTDAAIQREAEQARIEAERQVARAQAERIAEEARQQKIVQDREAEEKRRAEAERLSREVEEKRLADEKRIADEQRLADERHAAEERRIAAEKADADRKAEAARLAEERRKAEEARVAEIKQKAEAAEAKRIAEEARVVELKRLAEEAEAKRRAEEDRLAEQRRIADAKAAEQRAALEAQREAEAQRIAEKFRLAREARERNKETRTSLGGPRPDDEPASPFIETAPTARATYPQRVTVLVVMQPRRHGFAGSKMTANPVLCVGSDCYVSNGAGSSARMMRRGQALGPGNTIGRNAGVCRNHTTCVFRGVTLPAPLSAIQPVDMGFLRHDRREIRTVEPDRTCDVVGTQLSCSGPIETEGYRAWIVPEGVAEKAGARALESAVDQGLPTSRSAAYGSWNPSVQALPTR